MKRLTCVIAIFLLVGQLMTLYGTEPENHDAEHQATEHHEKSNKKFNASEFIFDHIQDAHDWHLFTYKETHVSIPLPIILYSKNNGFVVFMSSKFHHSHKMVEIDGYKYNLESEGQNKGKITEKDAKGNISIPLDLSVTKNIASLFISVILIVLIFLRIAKRYKTKPLSSPKKLQSLLEPIILFIRDEVAKPSIGHKYERYMPYLLTLFFFIWINNTLGLIPFPPGGANLTGNIAITMVMALFTFFITSFSGNKNYWKHIFNTPGVPWWLKIPVPMMPFIEFIGIFIKPFVLMIRLFANITAGHIIGLGFLSLIFIFGEIGDIAGIVASPVTVAFMIFMSFLELLVAFIQAYVFTFLSALYFGMAVEEHH